MIELNHTPGPWFIGQGKNTGSRTIIADDETWVGFAYGMRLGVGTVEQAEANAKLIAAAPDMLTALQAAIDLADKNLEADQPRTDECQKVYDQVISAIKKATK